MVADPLVSVAMSVYNAAATVELAFRSILRQTFDKWELIVVDDGSTDSTPDILARVRDSRIRIVQEPRGNLGLAPRLNQCVQFARGPYVARMDADDIAYPRRLEQQVRFLDAHPEIDLVGTGAVVFKGAGEVVGCYPTACMHEAICRRPWWGFPLAHPTWMGRRTWFVSHPYPEGCLRCEDQALLLKSFSDSRFAALDEVLLGYRLDGISARKMGQGRLNYCRQLVQQAGDVPSALAAARGVVVHGLAFGRDALFTAMKTMNRRSRQSFQVASDPVRHEWHKIWSDIASEVVAVG